VKVEVNRLKKSVNRRFNEWRNDLWSAILEFIDPEDKSPRRIRKRVKEFLLRLHPGFRF
jgi:hypothetical protein